MKRTLITLALLASTALVGCGSSLQIATPTGFAELEDQQSYGYRATNSEGVVLAVRREDNAPYGDLDFWSGALDAHLRRKGYKAVSATDVQTSAGISGKQIRYVIGRGGREHAFWVTVFVTNEQVVTVEVGGDKAFFDKLEKPISKAIASLKIG